MAARFVGGRFIGFTSDDEPPVLLFSPAPYWATTIWPGAPSWVTWLEMSMLYILVFTLLWPIGVWTRARYGQSFKLEGTPAKAYRWVHFAALGDVVIMAALVLGLWSSRCLSARRDPARSTRRSIRYRGLIAVQLLGVVPVRRRGGGRVWNLFAVVWRDGGRSWFAKLSSSLILIAMLIFAWQLFTLHLIGWDTHF